MKRRLQTFLEKTYGSAYDTGGEKPSPENKGKGKAPPTAQPQSKPQSPPLIAGGSGKRKKEKGRAAKNKQQSSQPSSPAGERFDLRCGVTST